MLEQHFYIFDSVIKVKYNKSKKAAFNSPNLIGHQTKTITQNQTPLFRNKLVISAVKIYNDNAA